MDVRLLLLVTLALLTPGRSQEVRRVGRLQEVFAWKQITFNINGNMILEDRFGEDDLDNTSEREKRQTGKVFFGNEEEPEQNWNSSQSNSRPNRQQNNNNGNRRPQPWNYRPVSTTTTTTASPNDEARRFFIQYNNLPMGVERVGNRLFVTLPRRRYGIPSTLNYLDLKEDSNRRSAGLRPYPDLRRARALTSVYRTRADDCGRLWMVDTGLLEIPNNRQQVQPPAVVIYDLKTDRQILRYPLKSTDIISETTPTGLASITVDITDGDCAGAFAYIPDLTTYGLIVYSLRDNDSWRLTHNYFSFNPTAGNLNIAGRSFQWSDGIFSLTLSEAGAGGCRVGYFHAMVGTHEFSVSTCVLKNRTASQADDFWTHFSTVGDRGVNSQSTMHGYHAGKRVIFFADIARNAVSCWQTGSILSPTSVEILAQDSTRLSYPSDLHVSGDEVWVMANSLPTWAYSRLDTDQYNFFIYKQYIPDLISGTVCGRQSTYGSGLLRSGDTNDTDT